MKIDFGKIKNQKSLFYFHQVQFRDGSFGIQITDDLTDEKGIIDTGFTGNIIFPDKYKGISNQIKDSKSYKLANGDNLNCSQSTAFIAFLDGEFEQEQVLFGKVKQPLIGMRFLENLEKVFFDFNRNSVSYKI